MEESIILNPQCKDIAEVKRKERVVAINHIKIMKKDLKELLDVEILIRNIGMIEENS